MKIYVLSVKGIKETKTKGFFTLDGLLNGIKDLELQDKIKNWDLSSKDTFSIPESCKIQKIEIDEQLPDIIDDVLYDAWSIKDIFNQAEKDDISITAYQARQSLHLLKKDHNAELGINWDIISEVIKQVKDLKPCSCDENTICIKCSEFPLI
jgi:hypothetical protein